MTNSDYYKSVILADSPAAAWMMNEATGTTSADYSGNGFTATYNNVYTLAGDPGPANDGSVAAAVLTVGYLLAGSGGDFNYNRNFTISAWAKSGIGTGNPGGFLSKRSGGYYLRQFSGQLNFLQSQDADIVSAGSIVSGWAYYATTVSSSGVLTLYVNGVSVGSTTTAITFNSSTVFCIGGDGGPSEAFGGPMCGVSLFSSELSGPALLRHYNAMTQLVPSGTSGLLLKRRRALLA